MFIFYIILTKFLKILYYFIIEGVTFFIGIYINIKIVFKILFNLYKIYKS